MTGQLLTPADAAKRLDVSTWALYRLSRGNDPLPYVQLGPKMRRYRTEDIEAYVAARLVQR